MSKERIALAMSGGVDSTVAAYLALQQGYDVTGIHLRLNDSPADEALQQSCEALGIKLIECDCRRAFHEKVIIPAAEVYVSGRTPNPCCECNKILKFAELFRAAGDHGMDKVWTGHYVTCVQDTDGRYMLRRGSDNCKDQSYFLYRLTQAELSRVGFPLGSLSKAEVRQIATAAGLPCASRPDSQDACFQIPGECCGETLRRRSGITVPPGRFIYRGKKVGTHPGIHRYTIGQRQGLNVALGVPAYISAIDAGTGDIILTTDAQELLAESFTVSRVNWISGHAPDGEFTVKVRYRSPGVQCRIVELPDGKLQVFPEVPLRAVTSGQAAVFYQDEIMLGGGEIEQVM